jgi:hypothetical protein
VSQLPRHSVYAIWTRVGSWGLGSATKMIKTRNFDENFCKPAGRGPPSATEFGNLHIFRRHGFGRDATAPGRQ